MSGDDFLDCRTCDKALGLELSADMLTCDCKTGWFSLTRSNFSFNLTDHNNLTTTNRITLCAKCSELSVLEPARFAGKRTEWSSMEHLCPGGPVSLAPIWCVLSLSSKLVQTCVMLTVVLIVL